MARSSRARAFVTWRMICALVQSERNNGTGTYIVL